MKKCCSGKSVTFETPAELVVVRQGLEAYVVWCKKHGPSQSFPAVYESERIVAADLLEGMPQVKDADLLQSLKSPVSIEVTPINGGE